MTFVLSGLAWLLNTTAYAQTEVIGVDPPDCIFDTLSCETDLLQYVSDRLINNSYLYSVFWGLLFAMLVIYGFELALKSRTDSAIGDAVKAYTEALTGAGLVAAATILGDVFGQIGEPVADLELFERSFLQQIIAFFIDIVGVVLIANIVIQGIRMIVSVNEGNTTTARTNFVQSLVGAAIVMLAVPVIGAILPGTFNSSINDGFIGIANFLATIFGFMAVVMFVIAGIYLILSYNDSLKDKARQMIINSIVALIIIITSWALIQILLPTTPL